MANFVTIAEAIQAKKGDIIVHVVSLGELKTGASDKGPWSKQEAVVKDKSGATSLTLWNEDIGRLEAGKTYSLESPYWNEYKGKVQLSLGQYCTVKESDDSSLLEPPTQTTMDTVKAPETTKGIDFTKINAPDDKSKIEFAKHTLEEFIKTVKEADIEPEACREQFGTVWNTAMMQKK